MSHDGGRAVAKLLQVVVGQWLVVVAADGGIHIDEKFKVSRRNVTSDCSRRV